MFKINRQKLLSDFISLINKDHLIVVGEPGSGKSWLMELGYHTLKQNNIPCILLKADELKIDDFLDFKKEVKELDVKGGLEDAFIYIGGGKKSVLFIDALDAARSEIKQRFYRRLINLVISKCPNWTVVASIRGYDARHSEELLNLFPAYITDVPAEYTSSLKYRHLNIPLLTLDELSQVFQLSPILRGVCDAANDKHKKLFRLPFNLWLLDKLVLEGVRLELLSAAQTTVQLFGLYWEYRINQKANSEDRKKILRNATQAMVNNHVLAIDEKEAYSENLTEAFKDLKSDGILLPLVKSESRIAFSHNMLFDYAVSRLLIEEDAKQAYEYLSSDISRPIFLRPSVEYYFARLWHDERKLFWAIFWRFQQGVGEYLKLLPAITLVNEAAQVSDLDAVIDKLNTSRSPENLLAANRILRALRTIKDSLVRGKDELWIDFVIRLSSHLDVKFINEYVSVLSQMANKWREWDMPEQKKIGKSARQLMAWCWGEHKYLNTNQVDELRRVMAARGIPLVCQTFAENVADSEKILSSILERIKPGTIIGEAYSLVNGIEHIWPTSPKFATSIFEAIFRYKEESDEMTNMRGGVLNLSSNRRQDYNICYYLLAEKFPKFLRAFPLDATEAMVKSISVSSHHDSWYSNRDEKAQEFDYFGVKAKYKADGSHIWDDRDSFRERDQLKMLLSLRDYLTEILSADIKGASKLIKDIVHVIAVHCDQAVVWRYLLKIGRKNPSIYAPILYPLVIARPILLGNDTFDVVGPFISEAYKYFNDDEKKLLESTLINMKAEDEKAQSVVNLRNRLLLYFPEDAVLNGDLKDKITKLRLENKTSDQPFRFEKGGFSSHPYTEEDHLKDEGVNLELEQNKKLLSYFQAPKAFIEKYLNGIPSVIECEEIFPKLKELHEAIEQTTSKDEKLLERAVTHLTSGCERLVRNIDLKNDNGIIDFCETVFRKSSKNKFPVYEERNETFDSPSWSDSPRNEAAEGIMSLVRRQEYANEANLKVVETLSGDTVPVVRYQIMRRLLSLYSVNEKFMWDVAEHTAKNETTNGVLTALADSICDAAGARTNKVLDLVELICSRQTVADRKKSGAFNDPCVSTITGLYIVLNNERANSILNRYEADPEKYVNELSQVTISAINFLTAGMTEEWKGKEAPDKIRERTREVLLRVLTIVLATFKGLQQKFGPKEWFSAKTELVKEFGEMTDVVARWLYFKISPVNNEKKLEGGDVQTFYTEIKPLIQKIVEIGNEGVIAPQTAHHLIQLSNSILNIDPPGVIAIARDVCKASKKVNYPLDSMAIEEVVKLVEVYLADYKEYLHDKENVATLMELLNFFVEAGWTNAIKLAIKLDEVWR